MRKIVRDRRGITLIELIVSVTLMTILIGVLSAVFISSNKIYTGGNQISQARQLGQNVVFAVENKLVRADTVMLTDDGSASISSSGGKVIIRGLNSDTTFGDSILAVQLIFYRSSDKSVRVAATVKGQEGETIYEATRVIMLTNLAAKDNTLEVSGELSSGYKACNI